MIDFFSSIARTVDAQVLAAMDAVITAGIADMRLQIAAVLSLMILILGALAFLGRMDLNMAATAAVRAVCISFLLQAPNFNYYVRDLFFTDLPNRLAAAVGGPRVDVSSAAQFDALLAAGINAQTYVLSVATGFSGIADRVISYIQVGLLGAALVIIFALWLLTRIFMAIIILLGPFVLMLFLFQATRRYVEQWVGMLIGMVSLQLGTSIVLRILLVIITDKMRTMQAVAQANASVDVLHTYLGNMALICWFGVIIMVCLPGAIALGAGSGASAAVMAGGQIRSAITSPTRLLRR